MLQHLHDSAHCYRIVNADQCPTSIGSINDHDDPNNLSFHGEDSTVVLEEHYESDGTHDSVDIPNKEPGACALSHVVLNWSSSSEDDNDIDGEDDNEEEASVLASIYGFMKRLIFPVHQKMLPTFFLLTCAATSRPPCMRMMKY